MINRHTLHGAERARDHHGFDDPFHGNRVSQALNKLGSK
jgi:hypothetical protein